MLIRRIVLPIRPKMPHLYLLSQMSLESGVLLSECRNIRFRFE